MQEDPRILLDQELEQATFGLLQIAEESFCDTLQHRRGGGEGGGGGEREGRGHISTILTAVVYSVDAWILVNTHDTVQPPLTCLTHRSSLRTLTKTETYVER